MKRQLCRIHTIAFLVALLVADHCCGQGTLRFTFDGTPIVPPGSDIGFTQYFEQGMWFRPIGPADPGNQFGRTGGGIAFFPENGSAYLHTALGDSLTFSFLDGSLFNLESMDLAEYSTVVPDARTVHIIGYRHDGTVVTTDVTTDGIIDGTGPLADFQTFYFGAPFTSLDCVAIPGYGWSLDNLRVSIPEPSSGSLLLLGCLVFCVLVTNLTPNKSAAANRRPAGPSDGSDNLSATLAADRAFPAAVAELDR
jgi:hypothetical protein